MLLSQTEVWWKILQISAWGGVWSCYWTCARFIIIAYWVSQKLEWNTFSNRMQFIPRPASVFIQDAHAWCTGTENNEASGHAWRVGQGHHLIINSLQKYSQFAKKAISSQQSPHSLPAFLHFLDHFRRKCTQHLFHPISHSRLWWYCISCNDGCLCLLIFLVIALQMHELGFLPARTLPEN